MGCDILLYEETTHVAEAEHMSMIDLAAELEINHDEVTPQEFYRAVFPEGELAEAGKKEKGKYTAIAVEMTKQKKQNGMPLIKRYTITDDLQMINRLLESENFIIISPISYAGKSRLSENARFMYGLCFDLDGISTKTQLADLLHQMKETDYLPQATYIVCSGSGLHLYYLFKKPIPLFKNVSKQLEAVKKHLTKRIWNKFITDLWESPQIESLYQGFRLAGGVAKNGSRTRIFETGDRIDLEELNNYLPDEIRITSIAYKSSLTKAQAKEKYPEWYEKRVIKKESKGTWTCKSDLYYWWLRRIKTEATTGHRYFCIFCLAIYAKKSGISQDQLEKDAFSLVEEFDYLTTDEGNHFTNEDVLKALEAYNNSSFTYPIDFIKDKCDIFIQRNRRNGRKQKVHLERIRALQKVDYPNGEWRKGNGRPTRQAEIESWQQSHPEGTKADCIRETGASKPTVYKYWKV